MLGVASAIHLQIAALLRSAIPLAPNAAKAMRDATDPRQRRPVLGVQHHQARIPARSERMITPWARPLRHRPNLKSPYRTLARGIRPSETFVRQVASELITRADGPVRIMAVQEAAIGLPATQPTGVDALQNSSLLNTTGMWLWIAVLNPSRVRAVSNCCCNGGSWAVSRSPPEGPPCPNRRCSTHSHLPPTDR